MSAAKGKPAKDAPARGEPVRRSKGARAIAQLVPALIAPAAKRYGFSSADLLAQWTEIVGADMAGRCTPEKIAWPKRRADADAQTAAPGAVLHLRSPARHALDIRHETHLIAERLNAYFGYRAIERIVVRQAMSDRGGSPAPGFGETPQAALRPQGAEETSNPELDAVADAGLRDALGELKRHVAAAGEDSETD